MIQTYSYTVPVKAGIYIFSIVNIIQKLFQTTAMNMLLWIAIKGKMTTRRDE